MKAIVRVTLILLLLSNSCYNSQPISSEIILTSKIRGVNFSGPGRPPLEKHMVSNVAESYADWVALIPEATTFRQNLDLVYDQERQWWGEKTEANVQAAIFAKEAGLKVMLKPHLILEYDMSELRREGRPSRRDRAAWRARREAFIKSQPDLTAKSTWRGDFAPKNPDNWQAWEAKYEAYILKYARLADSLQADMFCVGTELSRSAVERDAFWRSLIQKVRQIYQGPLTYSANWDNFDRVNFWDALDYIGVNAYFPLHKDQTPTVTAMKSAWKPHVKKIKRIHEKFDKPIIFTEYGYRNVDHTAKEPWKSDWRGVKMNQQAQLNAYEALYSTFWNKSWFGGGFLWKWLHEVRRQDRIDFSPQGKPALESVKKWYGA